jgi:hypothetical protein
MGIVAQPLGIAHILTGLKVHEEGLAALFPRLRDGGKAVPVGVDQRNAAGFGHRLHGGEK